MSFIKRELERQMREGCTSLPGAVCAECFTDYAIKEFVDDNATETECSYCHRSSDEPIAALMSEVQSFISEGIWREYDIPENTLPYDSSEGGWQLVTPNDSYELFYELDICSASSGNLYEDLADSFFDNQFVVRDPLGVSQADGLRYSWSTFCDHTKHETRFVFFKVPRRRAPKRGWDPDDDYSPPYEILPSLGEMVKHHDLIKSVPAGTTIIRARQHPAAESLTVARDLGSPPKERASQSRMSPAGIPMFYGAVDEITAFLEIFDPTAVDKNAVTVAWFSTTRPLNILDLTQLPRVPSIFDGVNYDERPSLIFLQCFRRDISEAIQRDGREHYEYVPTQIVAEYFRRVFKINGSPIDGLKFDSSREGSGVCYCLFATAQNCTDGPTAEPHHMVCLQSHVKRTIDFETGTYH